MHHRACVLFCRPGQVGMGIGLGKMLGKKFEMSVGHDCAWHACVKANRPEATSTYLCTRAENVIDFLLIVFEPQARLSFHAFKILTKIWCTDVISFTKLSSGQDLAPAVPVDMHATYVCPTTKSKQDPIGSSNSFAQAVNLARHACHS
jgi:hypothetical protein